MMPTPEEIERKVREYLGRNETMRQLGAEVLPHTATQESWGGWSILVGTERDPPSTSAFLEQLGQISEELLENEHWDVLVAPSGARPSETR